jgi:hypothetical protein
VTDCCWEAIKAHDRVWALDLHPGAFEAQTAMFPNMITPMVRDLIERYQDQRYWLETVWGRRWWIPDPGGESD